MFSVGFLLAADLTLYDLLTVEDLLVLKLALFLDLTLLLKVDRFFLVIEGHVVERLFKAFNVDLETAKCIL